MARSTKIQKIVTDALASRITTTESGITAIQARNLLDVGDNVSELNNDAGYQNATQVDAKITAVVGVAPAALDTLEEIAAKLADEDDAIAALVSVNTTQNTAITALQTSVSSLASVNDTQATDIAALVAQDTVHDSEITQLQTDVDAVEVVNSSQATTIAQHTADIDALEVSITDIKSENSITRLPVSGNFDLNTINTVSINVIATAAGVGSLPSSPQLGRHYLIKNSPFSTATITVNSVAIVPGDIYEIQWDGTEWVEW